MILIDNKEGLIGDFLGTIPAMQKLAEKDTIFVEVHPEVKELFSLIKNSKITDVSTGGEHISNYIREQCKKIALSSSPAFDIANKKSYYMTQAFMEQAGLEVPIEPPKAKLTWKYDQPLPPVDYLLSPFARSLPEHQKWQKEKWQQLIKAFPDKKFGVLGNYKYDDPMYVNGSNVTNFYSMNFNALCKLFLNSKALISVVTGTSHLAFHLGLKNILLTNQFMTWGNNPEAIKLMKNIHDITINEVIEKL